MWIQASPGNPPCISKCSRFAHRPIKKARPKPCHLPTQNVTRYDLPATSRLLCTLKAPNTWLARMPATCLSIELPTTPYKLKLPWSTTIRIGLAGSMAYRFSTGSR